MTALLTSVRDLEEAYDAAAAGADLLDLKEPRAGALGALPAHTVRQVVQAVRRGWPGLPLSATIGDHAAGEHAAMLRMADMIGGCGVDYVKVGLAPGPHAGAALEQLARLPWQVVPVFLADHGLDLALVAYACALGFPAVMADTEDKQAGSLFDCVGHATLASMIGSASALGCKVGLAGALRLEHVPQLRALAPDIAGFRSALCEGARASRLAPAKVRALRAALSGQAEAAAIQAA
ncbi:(5-formylfuran-3-yl)methyl phosphate synthase [Cupriavidus necator]|uniref:(5-formylfuran-3-yl)methyl phosphate synthase n=1 Tax=Cupriavidus necator TaxID=106590 RepID=UPI00339D38C5